MCGRFVGGLGVTYYTLQAGLEQMFVGLLHRHSVSVLFCSNMGCTSRQALQDQGAQTGFDGSAVRHSAPVLFCSNMW